ncbi:hypothetical protein DE146DRAFT_628059 [Phaeosphaeria sp. MPI-PUGE-AT-0046c]|nr:hypothetical protein DE146DRAFT_628059 [Phaeosphaeria sp. MPI-PUGE-AT-0046c]
MRDGVTRQHEKSQDRVSNNAGRKPGKPHVGRPVCARRPMLREASSLGHVGERRSPKFREFEIRQVSMHHSLFTTLGSRAHAPGRGEMCQRSVPAHVISGGPKRGPCIEQLMAEVKLTDGDDVGKPEPRHASVTMRMTLGAKCGLSSSNSTPPRVMPSCYNRRFAVQRGIVSIQNDLGFLEANVQQCTAIAVKAVQQCNEDPSPVQIGQPTVLLASSNLF